MGAPSDSYARNGGTALDQDRLFHLAYDAVTVTAVHQLGKGWRLSVSGRRQLEDWSEGHKAVYEYLTTQELVDTMEASLGSLFGI